MASSSPRNISPSGGTFAALRHRNFRLWWISLLVSGSGTWLQNVAQDALVYDMTGRALDLGLINVVRAVALISLAFFGGTIADRLDKKKLIMATQTGFAVLAALTGLLAQVGALQVWHLYVIAFITSAMLAIDQPARSALVPRLVPREDLMNAIALNSVSFTGAAAFGPALAGPLVHFLGVPAGFYLNALSFAAVIWAVRAVNVPTAAVRQQAEKVTDAIVTGLRYVWATPVLLLVTALLTAVSFFATPYQSLLPVYAKDIFHGGVKELGWLRAAPGAGALIGSFVLAGVAGRVKQDRLVIMGILAFCASLIAFAMSGGIGIALAILFVAGLALTIFQSIAQTLMQQMTTDEMRGRVMSLFAISVVGMWPLGAGPMSWGADQFGVTRATIVWALIPALFVLVLLASVRPLFRKMRV